MVKRVPDAALPEIGGGRQDDPASPQARRLTDAEWRARLSPEEYRVLRRRGTEPAFTGKYVQVKTAGTYHCAGCGAGLFASDQKYESGTGWPSFWDAVDPAAITRHRDWSLLIPRTEIRCARCGGHLGHVFNDGPRPTGRRYCVNSAALRLQRRAAGEVAQEPGGTGR